MANPTRARASQLPAAAAQDAHHSGIGGSTSGAVTTAYEIVKEVGGLLENVPYIEAIAGIVVKIAAIRDEIKSNNNRCTALIDRVRVDWDSVQLNLAEVASTGHSERHEGLTKDLSEYLQILKNVETVLCAWNAGGLRGMIGRLTRRGELKDLMQQYETQMASFHQRFNMNRMVYMSVAVDKLIKEQPRPMNMRQPLPPKPGIVVGRGEEILKILDALKKHEKTPVRAAVLGLGGMGKTTIALSILHDNEIEAKYKAERYFVSCESAINAELLVNNIADTIGLPSTAPEQNQLISQVDAFFRDRHAVLCFDNLETTWDDPAHRPEVNKILNLLSAIPALVIIITMRGTQSPGSQDIVWLKVEITPVTIEDALDIYRKRALREPDEWARKLIEAVDNIPLAVTLIIHLVQEDGQSPQDLWVRWQKGRTSVLENGGTDRLSKLDASIWLSVQSPRMEDKSRNLLHLLSFLPDGLHSEFKLTIPLPGVPDLSSLLITLQRVSLIYTSPIPGSTALRYNMLSPIREYCRNTANFTPSPWPEWRSAITAFFSKLVVDHRDYADPVNYSIVVPELRNIRSILMETIQESTPNVQTAIWYTDWSRYIGVCDEEVIRKSLQLMLDPSDLALGYRSLGFAQQWKENLDGAEDSFRKSMQFSEQAENSRAKAWTLEYIGDLHLRRNNLDDAELSLSEAQALYDEVGSILDRANVRSRIGELHLRRNNLDDAEQSFTTALSLYKELQHILGQANVHHNMGELHMKRGDLDDAEKSFSTALPLYQQIQDVLGQANVHRSMGELYMRRGVVDDAEKLFSTALPLYQQIQDVLGQANVHLSMGKLRMKRGDLDDAEQCFSTVLALYQQIQDVIGEADVDNELGNLYLERDNLDAAEGAFSTSLALFEQLRNTRCQNIVRRNIRRLKKRKARLLGGDSTGEAASSS